MHRHVKNNVQAHKTYKKRMRVMTKQLHLDMKYMGIKGKITNRQYIKLHQPYKSKNIHVENSTHIFVLVAHILHAQNELAYTDIMSKIFL